MSVNWESTTWGQPGSNVHVGSSLPDAHDASEQDAERRFS